MNIEEEESDAVFYNLENKAMAVQTIEKSDGTGDELQKAENQRPLLVVLKGGNEDGGRQALVAFSTALSSRLSGVETSIFLVSAAVIWARHGEIEKICIRGFEPLSVYFKSFVNNKGRIYVSVPCMRFFYDLDSVLERKKIMAGVQYSGLTSLADMANSSTVLSF